MTEMTRREAEVLHLLSTAGRCMVVTHRTATGHAAFVLTGKGVSWPQMLRPMIERGWIEVGPLVPVAEHYEGFDPFPVYPDPWAKYHRRGRFVSITDRGREALEASDG